MGKKKNKKDKDLEEQLVKEILKNEEEEKKQKEQDEKDAIESKERAKQELREKRIQELRDKYMHNEKSKLKHKLRELREYYEKKYNEKLDQSTKEMKKAPKIVSIQTEETLFTKYNYNIVTQQMEEGTYSTFCKATKRGQTESYAVKITNLAKAPSAKKKGLLEEDGYKIIWFVTKNKQANIVTIYDTFICGDKYFLFQEFVHENLEQYLKVGGGAPEEKARHIAREIGEAVTFLHSNAIAHRDICAKNVLYDKVKKVAKLTNFEMSSIYWNLDAKEPKQFEAIHSKDTKYIAPEEREASPFDVKKADIWGWAAVVVYSLCKEYPPVTDFDSFRSSKLSKASEECSELLKKCFSPASERPEMYDVLSHPWFKVFITLINK